MTFSTRSELPRSVTASGPAATLGQHVVRVTSLRPAPAPVGQGSDVVEIAVSGPLQEAAVSAYQAIVSAVADQPRSVLCDLSRTTGEANEAAVDVLASAGLEVQSWPGVPIAVVSARHALRHGLARRPESQHLVLADRRAAAFRQLRLRPAAETVRAVLPASAGSARAARNLVARTLLDWGNGAQIGVATLVVNELVTTALLASECAVEVSVARCDGRIRLGVRDVSQRPCAASADSGNETAAVGALDGTARQAPRSTTRGMLLVAALAAAWGVLPSSGGGRAVWAVLATDLSAVPGGRLAARAAQRP